MKSVAAVFFLAAGVGAASGAAAGEDAGREAFATCRACHSLAADAGVMAGPSLVGLLGRVVGGDPAFGYSPVLRAENARGLVWTPERLAAFLADPQGMFPGMWMSSNGIRDADERAALARFITGSPSE